MKTTLIMVLFAVFSCIACSSEQQPMLTYVEVGEGQDQVVEYDTAPNIDVEVDKDVVEEFIPETTVTNCQNINCDDGNPCTIDFCLNTKCVNEVDPQCCLSVNDCPNMECYTETCKDYQCVLTSMEGCCSSSDQCDDNNECTNDSCVGGSCYNNEKSNCCNTSLECESSLCKVGICEEHKCTYQKVEGCCESGYDCDYKECMMVMCIENQCTYGEINGCCLSNQDCEDDDPCTSDQCVEKQCENTPKCPDGCDSSGICIGAECSSDTQCPSEEYCFCDNKTVVCKTSTGTCQQGVCAEEITSQLECSSFCDEGKCTCHFDEDCDDNNICTVNNCPFHDYCVFQFIPNCCQSDQDCEDDDPCTIDSCVENQCQHFALCPDSKECIAGECVIPGCTSNSDCQSLVLYECVDNQQLNRITQTGVCLPTQECEQIIYPITCNPQYGCVDDHCKCSGSASHCDDFDATSINVCLDGGICQFITDF